MFCTRVRRLHAVSLSFSPSFFFSLLCPLPCPPISIGAWGARCILGLLVGRWPPGPASRSRRAPFLARAVAVAGLVPCGFAAAALVVHYLVCDSRPVSSRPVLALSVSFGPAVPWPPVPLLLLFACLGLPPPCSAASSFARFPASLRAALCSSLFLPAACFPLPAFAAVVHAFR